MRIEINEYILTNDRFQYIIGIPFTDKKGNEQLRQPSYHSNLSDALENVLRREIMKSDATTFMDLQKDVQEALTKLQEQIRGKIEFKFAEEEK